jgi:predicted GNAT superfamily acetyltransferase
MPIHIRDLHALDDYRAVVRLEQEIWGYTDPADIITVPVFIITTKRGGILVGAFDEREHMVGFAFSIVGIKDGRPTQWSHMMGVVPEHRRSGLGVALKLAQRERATAAGFDLMEWTFDPLQALNAHLNFARLGVVCNEYARNVYGESTSALHRGTPTDRFVVEWHLSTPHVERRIRRRSQAMGRSPGGEITMRAAEAAAAPVANQVTEAGEWVRTTPGDLAIEGPRLWIEVPPDFTELQQRAPDLALEWRQHTREMFETYFARGYRAVDFELGRRRYLLAVQPPSLKDVEDTEIRTQQ